MTDDVRRFVEFAGGIEDLLTKVQIAVAILGFLVTTVIIVVFNIVKVLLFAGRFLLGKTSKLVFNGSLTFFVWAGWGIFQFAFGWILPSIRHWPEPFFRYKPIIEHEQTQLRSEDFVLMKSKAWGNFAFWTILAVALTCIAYREGLFDPAAREEICAERVGPLIAWATGAHSEWDYQAAAMRDFLDNRVKGMRRANEYRFVVACPTGGKTAPQIADELRSVLMKPGTSDGWFVLKPSPFSNWLTVAVEIERSVYSEQDWNENQAHNPFSIGFVNVKPLGEKLQTISNEIGSPAGVVPMRADWLINELRPGSLARTPLDRRRMLDELGVFPWDVASKLKNSTDSASARKILAEGEGHIDWGDWVGLGVRPSIYKRLAGQLLNATSYN